MRGHVDASSVDAMHCETEDAAFTRDDWIFELKLDGYRLIASKVARRGAAPHAQWQRLHERISGDRTRGESAAIRRVHHRRGSGLSRCQGDSEFLASAAARTTFRRKLEIRRAAVELPATFYAFDLLAFEDFDLRPMPLVRRRSCCRRSFPSSGPLRYLDHIEREGEAFLEQVTALGLEGNRPPRRRRRSTAASDRTIGSRSKRSGPAIS